MIIQAHPRLTFPGNGDAVTVAGRTSLPGQPVRGRPTYGNGERLPETFVVRQGHRTYGVWHRPTDTIVKDGLDFAAAVTLRDAVEAMPKVQERKQ